MLKSGSHIDGWVIEHALGKGGMGAVYRCRNRDAPRLKAAVKVLELPEASERFRREAEILCGLDHPNIVRVRDFRMQTERPYLVMDLVEGESLEALIERRQVGQEEMRALGLQLAQALAYAHERGVYHRDIKPANAILTPEGRVVVVDFGIAVEADAARLTTNNTLAPASVSYAPPEWLDGGGIDPVRWDVYSLGVVLYELWTREVAFPMAGEGSLRQQILRLAVAKQSHPPLDPGADAGEGLRALICAMTQPDPAARVGGMADVVAALRSLDAAPPAPGIDRAPTPAPRLQANATAIPEDWDAPPGPAQLSPGLAARPGAAAGAPTPTLVGDDEAPLDGERRGILEVEVSEVEVSEVEDGERREPAPPPRSAQVAAEPPSARRERISAPTFDIPIQSDRPPVWLDPPAESVPTPADLHRPPKRGLYKTPRWPFALLGLGLLLGGWWFNAADEGEAPTLIAPGEDAQQDPAQQDPAQQDPALEPPAVEPTKRDRPPRPRDRRGPRREERAAPSGPVAADVQGARPVVQPSDAPTGPRASAARAAAASLGLGGGADDAPEDLAPEVESLDAVPLGVGDLDESLEPAERSADAPAEPAIEAPDAGPPPDAETAPDGEAAPAEPTPDEAALAEPEPDGDAAPAAPPTGGDAAPAEPEPVPDGDAAPAEPAPVPDGDAAPSAADPAAAPAPSDASEAPPGG